MAALFLRRVAWLVVWPMAVTCALIYVLVFAAWAWVAVPLRLR